MRSPTIRGSTAVLAAVVLPVVAALAGCGARDTGSAYSGTVQADSAQVGSTAGGRVAAVFAADGERVRKGAMLVRFDDRQQMAAYQAALGQRAQALASLRDLEAGPRQADIEKAMASAAQAEAVYRKAQLDEPAQVASARGAMSAAQADLASADAAATKAERDRWRAQTLYDQGAIPAQQLDAARSAFAAAQSAQTAAASRLATARSGFAAVVRGASTQDVASAAAAATAAQANAALVQAGARPDQITAARASLQAAVANAAAAAARLDDARVRAPADGIVDGLDVHPGDLVAPGAPVATIDEFGDPWVRIYVAQSDLQRARVGDRVTVRSDAVIGREFDGRIEAIDARAQFTPRDVQTAGDRANLTFGVKVRIHDPDRLLHAGTTVDVVLP